MWHTLDLIAAVGAVFAAAGFLAWRLFGPSPGPSCAPKPEAPVQIGQQAPR